MLQTNEDEEFVVMTAGPPLPIRRARPLKTKSSYSPSSTSATALAFYHDQEHDFQPFHHRPTCPHNELPKASYSHHPPYPVPSKMPSKIAIYTALGNTKTTQTLPPSPSPVSTPIATPIFSRSPTPSIILHPTQKSRPPTPPINVESKVKLYIEQVKKFDEENRLKNKINKREKVLSLEDLYQVTTPEEVKDLSQMEEKLRETLRIIKEKDEVINKLRESCHELKLKYAAAENRIDEMRFGYGVGESQTQGQGRRSSFTNFVEGKNSSLLNCSKKRSSSEVNLCQKPKSQSTNTERVEKVVMTDKGTGTDKVMPFPRVDYEKEVKVRKKTVAVHKSQSNITTDEELGDFDLDLDSRESNFDPVLEEKCSNWLEKIQNWKTDPSNNTSLDVKDKDSCGDRDSGFRGSAELEAHHSCSQFSKKSNSDSKTSHRFTKSRSKDRSKLTLSKEVPKIATDSSSRSKSFEIETETIPTLSKSPTPERHIPISTTAALISKFDTCQSSHKLHQNLSEIPSLTPTLTELEPESGPPSLQIAQPWNIFSGNVNPNSATDYEGFLSLESSKNTDPDRIRSMSMDRLNSYDTKYLWTNDEDKGQIDHRELLRRIDKRFKTLHPLIDNATNIALRVKRKSESLAKIVKDNNNDIDNIHKFRSINTIKNRQSFS